VNSNERGGTKQESLPVLYALTLPFYEDCCYNVTSHTCTGLEVFSRILCVKTRVKNVARSQPGQVVTSNFIIEMFSFFGIGTYDTVCIKNCLGKDRVDHY